MDRYRVRPGSTVDLSQWDTSTSASFEGGKREGKKALLPLNNELEALQELLYAEGKHKVLIVLQAMDTGGKDGTIRHVFEGVNPQGVDVASFKKPSDIEIGHDYLWRVHAKTPSAGEIVIFNRSHYEDVLVVRVHDLVPPDRWEKRYEHINNFEKLLSDEGTTIIKFFLHISKEEQKERLNERLENPEKHWKFAKGDLDERALWDEYQQAYEAALSRTSTEHAPWFVVPADRKWYRNLVISQVIIDKLGGLDMAFPPAEDDLDDVVVV